MDIRYNKPQFNVSLFNRQVHVIINQKFAENLKDYINNLDEQREDWLDLSDGLSEAQATKHYRSDNENPEFVITEYNGVFTVAMDSSMAEQLARLILNTATHVCKDKDKFDFNAFIAFGRRLESASRGEYENLNFKQKVPPHMMAPYNFMYPPQHMVRRR